MLSGQMELLANEELADALSLQANAPQEERGAIFTRLPVVEFILDMSGYRAGEDLSEKRILEPSFGNGDFLLVIIDRLLESFETTGKGLPNADQLSDCIRAVEVHADTFEATKAKVQSRLQRASLSPETAKAVSEAWLVRDDFLLADLDGEFDVVVGNPPYVRQELIPDILMAEYRRRYRTIFDRADLYVPFFERSLDLLKPDGKLAFICADRWMKNRYGRRLRRMIANNYSLTHHIDMTGVDAFEEEVDAYPSITIIGKGSGAAQTRVVRKQGLGVPQLAQLGRTLLDDEPSDIDIVEVENVVDGEEPWLLDHPRKLALVRKIEARFPSIELAGCKVGIGVATGADKVFIGDFATLPVEEDRKLPLAMRRDITGGKIVWRGRGVINPFRDDGKLVDLEEYPKLKAYLEQHEELIRRRNVAKRSPIRWFRTIDRIHRKLTYQPKLLIPDIAGEAQIAYEDGNLYPHHNLYFVTSREWDLHALRAVLASPVARLFVGLYSTKMRGGYLRFQAQYLRRICLPRWEELSRPIQNELIKAGRSEDAQAILAAVTRAYELDAHDQDALREAADENR